MMTDSNASLVIDRPEEGIERITFNRPEKLNAFNAEMYDGILAEFDRIAFDPSVRVVIITGAGRGFCSGNDLGGMGKLKQLPEGVGRPYASRYMIAILSRIPSAMRALPQPVIAAVNGATAGIGFSLALAADIAVAGHAAKFVNAVHNAGTGAELGMSYMLPRAVGTQRAAEILLTQRPILAQEAADIGLVLKAVPDEALMDETLGLARAMMANVPMGNWVTKQALWANQNAGSLEAAMDYEHRGVFISQSTEDAVEKRSAFIEKRAPTFHNR
jgi:enoyl-CoA hydratase